MAASARLPQRPLHAACFVSGSKVTQLRKEPSQKFAVNHLRTPPANPQLEPCTQKQMEKTQQLIASWDPLSPGLPKRLYFCILLQV